MSRALRNAGAEERYAIFRPLKDSRCEKWLARYNSLKNHFQNGGVYGFIGPRGTGKTQMGISLAGSWIHNLNKTAFYTEAYDIYESIKESFGSESKESRNRRKYIDPDFLVIDALEVRAETKFESRELNYIINKRYGSLRKVTILISNDTKDSFEDFLGPSVISRMNETGGFLIFDGKSFREK